MDKLDDAIEATIFPAGREPYLDNNPWLKLCDALAVTLNEIIPGLVARSDFTDALAAYDDFEDVSPGADVSFGEHLAAASHDVASATKAFGLDTHPARDTVLRLASTLDAVRTALNKTLPTRESGVLALADTVNLLRPMEGTASEQ